MRLRIFRRREPRSLASEPTVRCACGHPDSLHYQSYVDGVLARVGACLDRECFCARFREDRKLSNELGLGVVRSLSPIPEEEM